MRTRLEDLELTGLGLKAFSVQIPVRTRWDHPELTGLGLERFCEHNPVITTQHLLVRRPLLLFPARLPYRVR